MSRKRIEQGTSDVGVRSPAAKTAVESQTVPSPEALELEDQLAQLRTLLERNDMKAARELVQALEARWPESDRVRHLARTLAPPVTRLLPGVQGRSREQERNWLRQHAHEYPNQWLAVLGNRLIAANPDVRVVATTVREAPEAKGALLHFQPGPPV
jgi:predicted trehalose synthase